jgi:hypothetical protein
MYHSPIRIFRENVHVPASYVFVSKFMKDFGVLVGFE